MIHEEKCTYEVCKLAKEKGFPLQKVIKQDSRAFFYELPQSHPDWANCDAWYLPTQSLLQRWIREEKRIEVNVFWDNADNMWLGYAQEMDAPDLVGSFPLNKPFSTYELVLDDALKYALENLVIYKIIVKFAMPSDVARR